MLKNNHFYSTLIASSVFLASPAYAISEASVMSFAGAMSAAANNQNIGQISRLIDDNAVISLTRQNKTTTLDKNGYLQLLQKSWANSTNYQYQMNVSNIVITGHQAIAQVNTTESWVKDGKKITLVSSSRTTLGDVSNNTVMLRSVSQITIN
jgi:hypothetical protein